MPTRISRKRSSLILFMSPNAVWLTKLFAGHDVASREEARQVFLGCENDPKAFCFAGLLGSDFDEVGRAADLGDALAQAWMASVWRMGGEERFQWAGKSAAQGERDGFFQLLFVTGVEKDATKTLKEQKRTF
jgi:hypothetical protein